MTEYIVKEARVNGVIVTRGNLEKIADFFECLPSSIQRSARKGSLIDNMYNIIDVEKNVKYKQIVEYAVSDVEDNDLIVFIGSVEEVSEYLNIPVNYVHNSASKGYCVLRKYKITRIEDEDM